MENKPENFSVQQVVQFAKTPAGQQLIALLQQSSPQALKSAAEHASSGDYQQAKDILEPLLQSPQIRNLLKQFGEN